ncbi:hypothetical protein DTQ03_13720 [Bacillus subtilis]|nr:hypothetical protein CXF51_15780 [Bacillus subtilis subsp. subtilis]AXV62349.1 hypothetical protein DTQ03_13720 [Bacillus subtilis]
MNPIYSKMREKKGESHIKTRSNIPLIMFALLVFFGGAIYWMLFSLKTFRKAISSNRLNRRTAAIR